MDWHRRICRKCWDQVPVAVNPALRRNRSADRGDLTVSLGQRTPVTAIVALRLLSQRCGTVFQSRYVVVRQWHFLQPT